MRILVTGSKGFIGKHMMEFLKSKNIFCIGCDRKSGQEISTLSKQFLIDNNIDCIIHLAAQTSVWNEDHNQIEYDNIQMFMKIFNIAKELNIKFVYASSSCAVNVTSMYGLSKHFSDMYAQIYGWDKCVAVRFHNVYGYDAREDTLMGICIANDEVTLYNNGYNSRFFTYIDDVVQGIYNVIQTDNATGIYNIYNHTACYTLDFCNEIAKHKSLNIKCIGDKRKYDKQSQFVDKSLKDPLNGNYIQYKDGIKKIFYILNESNSIK